MASLWWAFLLANLFTVEARMQLNCTTRLASKEYVCGRPGRVSENNPRLGNPFEVDSFQECRDYALATIEYYHSYRYSFNYNVSDSTCSLHLEDFFFGFTPEPQSSAYFYQWECFRCKPPSCPIVPNTNLLLNGDLELPNTQSAPWQQQNVVGGYKSKHALSSPVHIKQGVPLCTDSIYRLSFYYKLNSIISKVNASEIYYQLEIYPVRYSGLLSFWNTQKDWNRFETIVALSKYDATAAFWEFSMTGASISSSTKHAFLMDDIELIALDKDGATTPKPGATSILSNGGFESGLVDPWEVEIADNNTYGIATVGPRGIKSTYALKLETQKDKAVDFAFAQTVSTIPFTQYILSFDVRTDLRGQDQRGDSSMSLVIKTDGPGHSSTYTDYAYIFDDIHGYDFDVIRKRGVHSFTKAVIADGDSMTIKFLLSSRNGEDYYFDNIQLIESTLNS